MKINDVSSTGNSNLFVGEQYFSIQDQGMIFDILRNKMYSNPISAICREISCNARDAHREVGTPEKPIHIYLPNNLEPFLKIKDFGPGISPDRISNIFIKYAASTKRNDNIQTGGFGLGAKTPFSYSDSFTIITNYNGTQYNYTCFIDETKIGKITLLSQTLVDEPNGTEIIIPVKAVDFKYFASFIELSTRHWAVKPIIKGVLSGDFSYKIQESFLEGDGWQIVAHSDYNRSVKAIVDEIEYPLSYDQLRSFVSGPDASILDSCRGDILLKFGVGELSLSANREQIYFDVNTKNKINNAIRLMKEDLRGSLESKLQSLSTLWEANIIYHKYVLKFFNSYSVLGSNITWRGNILQPSANLELGCAVNNFYYGYRNRYDQVGNKIKRSLTTNISFSENSVLMVNDTPLKDVTSKHLKKFFEQNPKVKSVQLVCPHNNEGKINIDYLNKNFNFNLFYPSKLSDHVTISNRSYRSSSSRLIVYKFDYNTKFFFKQVSLSSIDADVKNKILCRIEKDSSNEKRILFNKNKVYSNAIVKFFNRENNYSLYAIESSVSEEKVEENFQDFESLEDFIERHLFEDDSLDYNQLYFARSMSRKVDQRFIRHTNNFRNLITNPLSDYLSLINLHEKIHSLFVSKNYLLDLYEIYSSELESFDSNQYIKNHPEEDLESLSNKIRNKYPLLNMINYSDYSDVVHVCEYINLIDQSSNR